MNNHSTNHPILLEGDVVYIDPHKWVEYSKGEINHASAQQLPRSGIDKMRDFNKKLLARLTDQMPCEVVEVRNRGVVVMNEKVGQFYTPYEALVS